MFDAKFAPLDEVLLSLSEQLVQADAPGLEDAVEVVLHALGDLFGADEVRLLNMPGTVIRDRVAYAWVASGARQDLACSNPEFFDRFPVAMTYLRAGQPMMYGRLEDLPEEATEERQYLEEIGLVAAIAHPILIEDELVGVLFVHRFRPGPWPEYAMERLPAVSGVFANALGQRAAQSKLSRQLAFERLLADCSARLFNSVPEDLDQSINSMLCDLGVFFRVDYAYVVLFSQQTVVPGTWFSYYWAADGNSTDEIFRDEPFDQRFPRMTERLREGTVFRYPSDPMPEPAPAEQAYIEWIGIEFSLLVPLKLSGEVIGVIILDSLKPDYVWEDFSIRRIGMFGHVIMRALWNRFNLVRLREQRQHISDALIEINTLKDRLETENILLREELKAQHGHEDLTGDSEAIGRVTAQIARVAVTDSTVLILGETGTGKELVANAVQRQSDRRGKPFVRINCAALPETLIEAELFGREKGAYTGALARQPGRFEVADAGTLLLDEIGELPLVVQAKLLRVLQHGEFERLGSTRSIKVDVRLITATNRDLTLLVREGKFREDLYYRLNVYPISVPPLRDRPEDIPALVWSLVRECCEQSGRAIRGISKTNMRALQAYPWPGNVRELRNVIERALINCAGTTLRIETPSSRQEGGAEHRDAVDQTLEEVERAHIAAVLRRTGWRIRGPAGAAGILGLKPTTLEYRIKRLGLHRPDKNDETGEG